MISREVVLVLGKTGSGKTTLAKSLVKPFPRVLVLDAGFQEFDAIHCPGVLDLYEYFNTRANVGQNFRVSYTPTRTEQQLLFTWARSIGQAEPMYLVLEECDRFPDQGAINAWEELVTRGRHYGVHMIGVSTNPYRVDCELRRQATEIYTFNQHEPRDIKWLSEVMRPDALDKVQQLKRYEYIKWSAESGEITTGRTTL